MVDKRKGDGEVKKEGKDGLKEDCREYRMVDKIIGIIALEQNQGKKKKHSQRHV